MKPPCDNDEQRQMPYPLRFHPGVREAADEKRKELDRSLNWVVNDLLKLALGLKEQSP